MEKKDYKYTMKIKIFQVNMERDNDRICFEGLETIRKRGITEIDPSIYDMVYETTVDADDLEKVFCIFNDSQIEDYTARSMSVSDIVVVKDSENIEDGAYFCDSFGFRKVDFDESLAGNTPAAQNPAAPLEKILGGDAS